MTEKTARVKKAKPFKKLRFTFTRRWFSAPYVLFIIAFIVAPMAVMIFRAFTATSGGFTMDNFAAFFKDAVALKALWQSLLIALVSTLACLLIGYPIAYIMAQTKTFKNPYILILLFILPMWINFLLRITALKELFELLSVVPGPDSWGLVVMGMVYDFLPFMILPLYNSLSKMDKNYLEAASDLGANKAQVFIKAVIPLSMPGIMSGITLVFVPVISAYAIAEAMSNNSIRMFGWHLNEIAMQGSVNQAAAMAIAASLFIVAMILISSRYERVGGESGGTML